MKRSFLAAALLIPALLLGGCSSANQSSPDGVVKSYYQAISKSDFKTACELIVPTLSQALGASCQDSVKDVETSGVMAGVDYSALNYGEPKIDGDKATLEVTDKAGHKFEVRAEKIDGSWYVNPSH